MYWQNIYCLCTPVLKSWEQLLNTKARLGWKFHITYKQAAQRRLKHMILWKFACVTKLSETCSSPSSFSSSHVSLSSCLAHTLTCFLCPAATYTCLHCWWGVMFQQWRNVRPMSCGENGWGAWWELSSHRSSLYLGTGAASGRGPHSRLLSQWTPNKTSNQQVSYTSQCWFFCSLSFFPPPLIFSFRAGTLLYIWPGLKNKGQRETKQSKCGNFS